MRKLIKIFIAILIIAASLSLLNFWYSTFILGHYFMHTSIFMIVLGASAPLIIAIAAIYLIKFTSKL
jgi:hypothetical protein